MPHKILAFGLIGALLFVGASRGDEHDKKTTLTVNEPLIVPGAQLQPGKYVMKLAGSQSNRNIVQIFNEDQNQLITTIMAIPNRRTTPTDDTALMYWETPGGPALRSWFFPGDDVGQEFAYPKETADRIAAANNNAKVAVLEEPIAGTTEVAAVPPVRSETESFAERADPNARRTERPSAERVAEPPQAAVEPQVAPAAQPREDNTLLAQNQPGPANPVQPNAAQPAVPANELPATASPMGWVMALSIVSLLGAFIARRFATNS